MSQLIGETLINHRKRSRASLDLSRYDLIEDLTKSRQDWKLKVRIIRMWDNITWIKKMFLGIDVILADEKGHYIQAFIKKDDVTHHREKLREGQLYLIKNFEVTDNKPTYRSVNNSLMINFIFATSLLPLEENDLNVPLQVFDLVPFEIIKLRAGKDIQLTDVIGRLKKLGTLDTINGKKGNVLRRNVEVEMESGEILKITLWSEIARSLDEHLPSDKSSAIVIILTSLTTRIFNGNITLGSTNQTRIYSDIGLPEIKDYVERTNNEDFRIELETSSNDTTNERIVTVKELTELIHKDGVPDGTKVVCCTTIIRIDSTKPWFFTSCPEQNCRKKLIYEEGKLKCEKCDKIVDTPIIRYRIEFEAEDNTGTTMFVLLDKLAERLIQVPVSTILRDNTEDGIPALLPEAIKNLIGTTHVFQIKLNNFNLIGKREGFTVNKLMMNEAEDSSNQRSQENISPTPEELSHNTKSNSTTGYKANSTVQVKEKATRKRSIIQGTPQADLIKKAKLIVWDEAPMTHRHAFEALDRTLRDILQYTHEDGQDRIFGGKTVLIGGDFRQILPVVMKGRKEDIIRSSISKSPIWDHCQVFTLKENMRLTQARNDEDRKKVEEFGKWILDLGDGKLPAIRAERDEEPSWIEIPEDLLIDPKDNPLNEIVNVAYPDLQSRYKEPNYLKDRCILAPTNEIVDDINKHIMENIHEETRTYKSSDTICKSSGSINDQDILYPTEFLNSLKFNGIPDHELKLKIGTPIILLRNINQAEGLCNGTRLIITHLADWVIEAEIMTGKNIGSKAFIPRIIMSPTESKWPFEFRRRQFPVKTCYAMTINKSQGQTLNHVALYLPEPVFSHGQLYVAVSRVTSREGLKILINNKGHLPQNYTRNIVYKEIFEDLQTGNMTNGDQDP